MNRLILMATLATILPWPASAQQSTTNQPQTVWGAASNGICAGVFIKQSDWGSLNKNDFYCNMELGNITTNLFWVWFPPLEQRYEIELWGPGGQRIRQLKPLFFSQKNPWLTREPFSEDEKHCLDWCFLKDTFEVRTNGQFTLIVSVRVNAFTNFAIGRSQMRTEPVYFLLPPVTNSFNVLLSESSK